MKKLSIILFSFCILSIPAMAQRKLQQLDEDEAKKREQLKAYENKNKGFDPDKMVYGGNAGLSFSNFGTFVMAQPMVGYRVLPHTILGVGANYIYFSRNLSANQKQVTHTYGPLVFAQQEILSVLIAHAEWQPINYEYFRTLTISERRWLNQFFVGGGYG
ncbi:MAG: hypothetical protein MH472_05680, partial [Bacteroidia bacterium]|nr:hypothetical protein [Bacteroidia bacterium]